MGLFSGPELPEHEPLWEVRGCSDCAKKDATIRRLTEENAALMARYPNVRLECIKELGYAIMYMNFLHPHRRIDKPFADSSGWHNQRIAVQTLCTKLADNQRCDDPEWWGALLKEIVDETENMC